MERNLKVSASDLVYGLSSALDLVSPALVNHHRQVLGFAVKLAEALKLSVQEKSDIFIAAMLHDIGVVAFHRWVDLDFDDASVNDHAELGFRLMRWFKPFTAAAELVRYHHVHWSEAARYGRVNRSFLGSNIIHLADRVAVQLDLRSCVLEQAADIRSRVHSESGGMFMPEVVEAFFKESTKEYFWLDARFDLKPQIGGDDANPFSDMTLDMDGLKELSELFRMIIDFRSPHTASHSRSVAHIAEALARLAGFSANGCAKIYVAGNLHDLGKLSLPNSILDKAGTLTEQERNLVKGHPYHSHRILKGISGLEMINTWASLHHEFPNGKGYPFKLQGEEIPIGARIIAVADTFAALTEARAYRSGMSRNECLSIMLRRSDDRTLDPHFVLLVKNNYNDLFDLQMSVQREGLKEYESLLLEAAPFISEATRLDFTLGEMT